MNNWTGLEYMYNQNCQTEHILTFKLLKQYLYHLHVLLLSRYLVTTFFFTLLHLFYFIYFRLFSAEASKRKVTHFDI